MIFDIASIILLFLSIGGVVFIVSRKLHLVSSIDVDMIPAERHSAMKNDIISSRIKRKVMNAVHFGSVIGAPVQTLLFLIQRRIRAFHAAMLSVRATYYKKVHVLGARASTETSPSETESESPVQGALRLIAADEHDRAESFIIGALKTDPRNPDLTDALVSIYIRKKEWQQASETSEYTCKLRHDLLMHSSPEERAVLTALSAESYSDLSHIYHELDRGPDAVRSLKKAVSLLPENPKYLHELTELYVALKMRLKAEQILDQLKAANPDQKVDDITQKIEALSY